MLDQSFSAQNFERIYDIEIRKGHIDINNMPIEYRDILKDIKNIQSEIKQQRRIAKSCITENEENRMDALIEKLGKARQNKDDYFAKYMNELATEVASKNFRFNLSKITIHGKETFTIDKGKPEIFFAMKQLQYNIKKTFKVKPANRHAIMSNIKALMNTSVPVYVIRTDISSFYESIIQSKLLDIIENNTLLSHKSRAFVKMILKEYEVKKDTSKEKPNIGIPRGVGISAYLSELYMRDLDSYIYKNKEVIFYARYVDDIFIILSAIPGRQELEEFYENIREKFLENGLELKSPSQTSEKCWLLDFTKDNVREKEMNYLGYKLRMKRKGKKLKTEFLLSDNKVNRLKDRINNAVRHFEEKSVCDLKQAIRDLIDSINYISGNTQLYKSKSRVKIGLYYNNDLLDDKGGLQSITDYLRQKTIQPYYLLKDPEHIKEVLAKKLDKVDFVQRWETRKTYKFSIERLNEIGRWL